MTPRPSHRFEKLGRPSDDASSSVELHLLDADDEATQVFAQKSAAIRRLEKLAARAAMHQSLLGDLRRGLVF
jgi:hypothetical protein